MKRYDYLIIGNSAAGVWALEKLRTLDPDGTAAICSFEPHHVYGRPLISYVLEGKAGEKAMRYRPADFYERLRADAYLGPEHRAVSIDPEARTVAFEGGALIGYGVLLVATGSVPFTPPIEGLAQAANAFPFITLDNAQDACACLRAATEAAHREGRRSRLVVVGGGLIGLKAAESLHGYADEVVVLELAPRILPAVLDAAGSQVIVGQLAERGIDCRPGITATRFVRGGDPAAPAGASDDPSRIVAAELTDGELLACDMVVAAVGVRPATALLEGAGAQLGRGVVCDRLMRTSVPGIYAAGDVTQTVNGLDGTQAPLALWPHAAAQGRVAGAAMAAEILRLRGASAPAEDQLPAYDTAYPVNAVDFFDISLLTGGLINPPEDAGFEVRVIAEGERYAKFVSKDDRLFGYILLNRPEQAGIYTALIEKGTPLSTLSEDFFALPPQNIGFAPEETWKRLHRFYPQLLDQRGWKVNA